MPIKIYTRSHRRELLQEIDNGEQLSSEQSQILSQNELQTHFASKENLLRWYLGTNAEKLEALGELIELMVSRKYQRVISLGAGPCVLEYLLRLSLPKEAQVFATDFNEFYINHAQRFFPEIKVLKFDFFHGSMEALRTSVGTEIDVAVFFGSAYAMSDEQFIAHLTALRTQLGVKEVIDFHAGCLTPLKLLRTVLSQNIRRSKIMTRIAGKEFDPFLGKFHGFSRTPGELRKIYSQSGFEKIQPLKLSSYPFAVALSTN